MKSYRYPPHSRWASANRPEAKARQRARADAVRIARPAPLYPPQPGEVEQVITFTTGCVVRTIVLAVPPRGCRCDQHAVSVDGARLPELHNATSLGRLIAGMVARRPSLALLSEAA